MWPSVPQETYLWTRVISLKWRKLIFLLIWSYFCLFKIQKLNFWEVFNIILFHVKHLFCSDQKKIRWCFHVEQIVLEIGYSRSVFILPFYGTSLSGFSLGLSVEYISFWYGLELFLMWKKQSGIWGVDLYFVCFTCNEDLFVCGCIIICSLWNTFIVR